MSNTTPDIDEQQEPEKDVRTRLQDAGIIPQRQASAKRSKVSEDEEVRKILVKQAKQPYTIDMMREESVQIQEKIDRYYVRKHRFRSVMCKSGHL